MNNVVLVTVDCMRTDSVGCYNSSLPTTPNIDDIAEDGMQFESCFATAGSTKFSFPAILGSIYYDMFEGNKFPTSISLLPELFREAGYFTAGFNAANPNLTPEFGYDSGFDEFDDYITGNRNKDDRDDTGAGNDASEKPAPDTNQAGKVEKLIESIRSVPHLYSFGRFTYQLLRYRIPEPYRKLRNYSRYALGLTPNALTDHVTPPASEIIDRGIEAASRTLNEDRPFFLWLHLMDPHSWYDPDQKHVDALYGERISRSQRFRANRALMSASPFHGTPDLDSVQNHLDVLKMLYHASVRQTDAAIGTLVEWIEENDLREDTVFAVAADHGEQFLEHGGVQHSGDVYPELTHVPLILDHPGAPSDSIDSPCSLLDVPTTLTALTGIYSPSEYLGRDVSGGLIDSDHRPSVSVKPGNTGRIAARDARYTLLRDENKPDRYYDRETDQFELSPRDIDEVELPELHAAIEEWRELVSGTAIASQTVDPSEAVTEQLEDLGYFQ